MGRVTYRLPLAASTPRSKADTGPDALPKQTISPRGFRQSRLAVKVSRPTLSYTTGTMAPPVMRFTSATTLSPPTMACAAPCARASAAFSSLDTTPITVTPRCFAHWHRISPTPPAAACTSTVSPLFTR